MKKTKICAAITSACLTFAVAASLGGSSAAMRGVVAVPLWKMQHFAATGSPTGYSPAQIKTAYGIDGSVGTGKGETIALVVADGDPNLESDLSTFSSQFDLPKANMTIHDVGTPGSDSGWALETALDTEWAHAMAPDANLLVVVASSDDATDLLDAVDYATSAGAQVVSMSWGSNEDFSQVYDDSHFQKSGTVFVTAAGDDGAGAMWPASSPNVISVGGTSLTLDSSGDRVSETAWSESGGGVSMFEDIPSWQSKIGINSFTRADPDVSFDANPSTGVSAYCSETVSGKTGWFVMGGTSLGAPSWAGIVADLNQNTSYIKNAGSLYTLAGTSSYTDPDDCFNDISSGSNGIFRATKGYDAITGLGSPDVASLASQSSSDATALAAVTDDDTSSAVTLRGGFGYFRTRPRR